MMTRRMFAGLLGAASTALAKTTSVVQHRILRRPWRHVKTVPPNPYMLWDAVTMRLEFKGSEFAPVRVTVENEGAPEAAMQTMVTPRSGEVFFLLGVHGMRAETPTTITLEARRPFALDFMDVSYMRPPFRRIDGQIVYRDSFYKPHPDTPGFGMSNRPHHRVIYGPGKDVGYFGGGRSR